MRIASVLIIISILPLWLQAQVFNGQVLDEGNHNPVEAVSVSIIDEEGMALCYTIAEDDGRFQLACDNKAARQIYFACLGYNSTAVDIATFKYASQVYLARSEIKLKEVEVKYQPIGQTGDTLNYDVGGFRLAQDRNIKDILKRLPGIEVEENGKIKYEGKDINKFYVENLDLTDGKYNLVTNNLAAKSVKTVQVFENHQPVSALRGTDFSDKAALNLLLEDEAKGKVMGVIAVGGGIENSIKDLLWENRLVGLIFGNKLQNITTYKNANTGNNIKEDLIDFGTGRTYFSDDFANVNNESDIFTPISGGTNTGSRKQRYFFNDTHFISTNTLSKITKNKQLRIQASYLNEKENQNSYSSTLYILPGSANLLVSEDNRVKNLTNQLEGRLTYDSNTDRTFLKNTLDVNALFKSNEAMVRGSENVSQKTNLDRFTLSNEFSFIHKYDKDKVLRFNSVNKFNRLPQKIDIFPGLYYEFTGDSIPNEHMVQNGTLQSFNSNTFTSFSHPLSVFSVDYKLGVNINTQLLETWPDDRTANLLDSYSDSLSNHYRLTETSLYFSPTLKFRREYLNISLALNSALKHFYTRDFMGGNARHNKALFLIQPFFRINYDINAYWRAGFSANYSRNYPDVHSLYSGYILKSYRNATNYNSNIYYSASFNNALFVSYKHPIKGFFANFSSSYSLLEKNNLTTTSFNGVFQQNSTVDKKVTNNSLNIFFNMSKTLPFWSSVVNFKYYYISYDNSYFLVDVLTRNNTIINNFDLSFTVAPVKTINIEGGGSFTFSRLKTVSPEPDKFTPVRSYKFDLAVNMIPNKKINFSWNNELNYNYINNSLIAYFSDISVSYLLKNSEIKFYVNNIFNETKYEKRELGQFSEAVNITFLHKRQLLIKYLFNF